MRRGGKGRWAADPTWLVVPGIFASFCILYAVQVQGISIQSTGYPYLLIAVVIVLLVFIAIMEVRRRDVGDDRPGFSIGRLLRAESGAVAVVGASAAYAAAAGYLGFVLTTALFLAFLLRFLGNRSVVLVAGISACASIGLFLLLTVMLKQTLPTFRFAELPYGL